MRWIWLLDLVLLPLIAGAVLYGSVLGFVVGLVTSILWISILTGAIVSTLTVRTSRYIVTNNRVILGIGLVARRTWELPLQLVSSIDVPQSTAQKEDGVGKIVFRSLQAKSIAFVRAREPMKVRQIALGAKARLPNVFGQGLQVIEREIVTREVLIQCPNCGSHYPQGTLRCSNCGATL